MDPTATAREHPTRIPTVDLVRYFLRLGALGFGGPGALCRQMERELVEAAAYVDGLSAINWNAANERFARV